MSLDWRQAITSALVVLIVVLGVEGLFALFGARTNLSSAVAIALGIGAGRLIDGDRK